MINNITAFIFPAFITDFTQKEIGFLKENNIDFNEYLQRASVAINIDLPEFSYESDNYKNDELKSQLLAYLFSCAFSDIFDKKGIVPQFIAGYSMGIYASLYAANSITLETGAKLIHTAFLILDELTNSKKYGLGATIGLTLNDIDSLIVKYAPETEIININNEHSLVIAGKKEEIKLILEKAKEEGAMSVVELNVNTPYHSKYLLKYSDLITNYIETISIKDAVIPIISTYDQKEFLKTSEIKSELLFNLTSKINWYNTMQVLLSKGVNKIYECGAGKDLKKISRFIKGDYKMYSAY